MTSQNPESKSLRRPVWYWALAAFLAVVLLALAIRGVTWSEMLLTIKQSDPGLLVFVLVMITVNLFLRGIRWGILLSGEKRLQPMTMFWATAEGYLGNALLPARAGELIRSAVVGVKTGIGTSYVLATALTERIIDAVVLVIVGMALLPGVDGIPDWMPTTLKVMAAAGLVGLAVLIVLPAFEGFLGRVIFRLPLKPDWKEKLNGYLSRFVLGTRAFVNPLRAAGFLGMTPVIWLMDGFITVELARAMSLELTLAQALLLMVGLGLSSALPSTPGYVGIYQFVATTILPVFGMSKSEALAFILFYQGLGVASYLFWSLVSLPALNIKPSVLRKAAETGAINHTDVD
jgi:uncharacterized protein (TIRG00374 family)